MKEMSEKQTAQAAIVTSTSPGPGARRSTFWTVSGWPNAWQTAARIRVMAFALLSSRVRGCRHRRARRRDKDQHACDHDEGREHERRAGPEDRAALAGEMGKDP